MTRAVEFLFNIVRDGADYAMLYPIQSGTPSLYLDGSKTISMALRGDFVDPGPEVNFLTDRIRPEVVIDGVAYPLGIFLPAKVETVITETGHHLSIQAYDQSWLLQTSMTETISNFAKDSKYTDAIDSLLDAAGIPFSLITENDYIMPRLRQDWLPGTSHLTIINDLLEEMNYNHIWFDLNGFAIAAPDPDPQNAQVQHILSEDDVQSLLIRNASIGSDFYSTPNVFIVCCSNFSRSSILATAVNNDMGSPVSVPRRGRRIISVRQVEEVPSQTVLQAIADKDMKRSMLRTESITVSTGILPDFGINEAVALNIDGEMSVCIERGWTMQMRPGGTMTHRMERVAANYD